MMNKFRFLVLIILVAAVAIILGWSFMMHTINTSKTHVTLWLAGTVDEVQIYNASDRSLVTKIQSQGVDGRYDFDLLNSSEYSILVQTRPAQYFFVTQQGDRRYQGRSFCCETGLFPGSRSLKIHSLTEWEVSDR